jgi:hypothetical protein
MGDRIKQLLLLAVVVVGAWQGWKRWKQGNTTGSFVAVVDGPSFCSVEVRFVVGDQTLTESHTLPWRSAAVVNTQAADIDLEVDIPLTCRWQPAQVQCAIERDGAAWRSSEASVVTNPQDGTPHAQRCAVRSR